MELLDICDKILELGLSNSTIDDQKLYALKRPDGSKIGGAEVQGALAQLIDDKHLARLDKHSLFFYLLPTGQVFAKNGGYAEQAKRQQADREIAEQSRLLDNEVNKSVLQTNTSILATNESVIATNKSIVETNLSVQTTNQSVIDTNASVKQVGEKTVDIYSFQKWTTALTIFVAIMALVIAWFSYKSQSDNENLLQLIQRQLDKSEQMQLQIDSLRGVLNEQSFRDTLPTKHP